MCIYIYIYVYPSAGQARDGSAGVARYGLVHALQGVLTPGYYKYYKVL